jgi:UDP-N-acetylglucosamine acyltransferase
LEIGDNNTVYEFVTFNRGTLKEEGVTRIGSHNFIMAYVHIAHDCRVGNHTVLANNTTFAGHVTVEDYALCGGMTAVHQFCRLGAYCYVGHGGAVVKDVPPYVMLSDYPIRPRGINKIGLERQGFNAAQIKKIREGFRILYRSDLSLEEARESLVAYGQGDPDIQRYIDFIDGSKRSIVR